MGSIGIERPQSAGFLRRARRDWHLSLAASDAPEAPIPLAQVELRPIIFAACPWCRNEHPHVPPQHPDDNGIRRCSRHRFRLYKLPTVPQRKKRSTMFTGIGTYPHNLSGREIAEAMHLSDSRVEQLWRHEGEAGRRRVQIAIDELIAQRKGGE